jgi:Bacteriocin-protection, YdeI or OmpD-Associated/Domain of unknown function (DUF1905)
MEVFAGRIYKVGIIRYVDVPREASRAMGARGAHVAVHGTVEAVPLVTTMVSRGKGCYRIAIHGEIRKKLKVDAGAIVEIALERDEGSREPALPPALVVALRLSPEAQGYFRGMTVSLRRQIVRYITAVKQQATMERRVAGMVRRLAQRARKKKEKQRAKRYKKVGRNK